MTAPSFLADLYQRRGGIKLGLGPVGDAFRTVRRRAIPAYHVAGTNGKGTVVYATAHLLRSRGLRTGLFVSPHIVDFNERIAIDGRPIPDATAERIFHELATALPRFDDLSFFEVTFLIAWRWWEEEAVERAVVEVGLGGRLDATNVIEGPKCDLIVSIGLDHTHILGETPELIALEKLGIVHRGDRVLLGATIEERLAATMTAEARAAGALLVERVATGPVPGLVPPAGPALSPEQVANLTLAHRAVTLTEGEAVAPDFSTLRLPGRFQMLGDRIILDVAHNPPAAAALAAHLRRLGMRPYLLYGAMRDKDIGAVLGALAEATGDLYPVPLTADGGRGADAAYIAARIPAAFSGRVHDHDDADAAIAAALERLRDDPAAPLLATGSFFLIERLILFLRTPRGAKIAADLHLPAGDIE